MKNLKTSIKLAIGFSIIILFVLALGILSNWQSAKLREQTKGLYEHPMAVRGAISELRSDVLGMHRGVKDIMLMADDHGIEKILEQIELYKQDAREQLDIIDSKYLGPAGDVDSIRDDFNAWDAMRAESVRLIHAGKKDEAILQTMPSGEVGMQVEKLMDHIRNVSDYAKKKAVEFNNESDMQYKLLRNQLWSLVLVILIFSVIVTYIVISGIRQPLKSLVAASEDFAGGNLDARCDYISGNEFGHLAKAFNLLADSVQKDISERSDIAGITEVMLEHENMHEFSIHLLSVLMGKTGAQVGAVYILNEQGDNYRCYESIGLDREHAQDFSALSREGEVGLVLSTGKIHRTTNIPENSKMIYRTVSGNFIPREIVTIPIITGTTVPALISLASIHDFPGKAITMIENLLPLLSSRMNGLFANRKILDFSKKLDQQNRELQVQKQELFMQTEEMRMQNTELEMQKQQLNEASRLKTNFLSNMSHELRTPLNSVIALSGVLSRRLGGTIPEDDYSYLEVIERNGKLLLSLINDILDISRIESGHEEIRLTEFSLGKMAMEVCQLIHPQAQAKKVILTSSEDDALPPVTTDYQKCRQILQNLIGNAVKFTEKGAVTVKVIQSGDKLQVEVTDTGIGIAEKNLPHIFDEFRQADGSTSRRYGGTGLGLTIALKYARMLGGEITVRSKPGEGSVFILILPLNHLGKAAPSEEILLQPVDALPDNLQSLENAGVGKTVLLVDDSDPAIVQLKDMLAEGGFQTLVASNGQEAISLLEEHLPDAIILDLMMPDVDGFSVLKTVRENPRTGHIPVLVLTAKHITKEELSTLRQNNIHQLIQKGDVNRKELVRAVVSMVSKKSEPVAPVQRIRTGVKKHPQILVVEDNPDNMLTLKALLSDRYEIIEAQDGRSGVEMAMKFIPDLILMDIALPEMNGIEALRIIRTNVETGHIPVVAVTASAMSGDRDAIVAEGFNGYISKPVDIAMLEKTIHDWLGR